MGIDLNSIGLNHNHSKKNNNTINNIDSICTNKLRANIIQASTINIKSYLSSSTSITHSSGVLSLAAISSVRWKTSMWSGIGISLSDMADNRVDFPETIKTTT